MAITIEFPNGGGTSEAHWSRAMGLDIDDPAGVGGWEDILNETHHRQYGRPWAAGRAYADYLFDAGLNPSDRVLDFGCGAGRVGVWLIPRLDPGRYFGVDIHQRSIEAFAHYEAPLHGLQDRRPRLAVDGSLSAELFGERFDWILDLMVSHHMPPAEMRRLYASFGCALMSGGRILTLRPPRLTEAEMRDLALTVERVEERASPLLALAGDRWRSSDAFHLLRKTP